MHYFFFTESSGGRLEATSHRPSLDDSSASHSRATQSGQKCGGKSLRNDGTTICANGELFIKLPEESAESAKLQNNSRGALIDSIVANMCAFVYAARGRLI